MTDQPAPALEPCPFCGESSAEVELDVLQGTKWGHVVCRSCGACGEEVRTDYDKSFDAPWRAEAIAAWNRRPTPPAATADSQDEVVEAVRLVLCQRQCNSMRFRGRCVDGEFCLIHKAQTETAIAIIAAMPRTAQPAPDADIENKMADKITDYARKNYLSPAPAIDPAAWEAAKRIVDDLNEGLPHQFAGGEEDSLTVARALLAIPATDGVVEALREALRNIKSQVHNLPRTATADTICNLAQDALALAGEKPEKI